MRDGIRIGVDAGKARVGVSVCDPSGLLATPVVTLERNDPQMLTQFKKLVGEYSPIEIVVGLPLNLQGNHTPSTQDAINLAREFQQVTNLPVRMIDERLTTVSAHAAMRSVGKKQRGTRSVIDQVAAVMVLQHALDLERSSGKPAGLDITEI